MTDTSTCAHGVPLNTPCADCDQVCAEIDRTGTVR
jgi:hypothetical protein